VTWSVERTRNSLHVLRSTLHEKKEGGVVSDYAVFGAGQEREFVRTAAACIARETR
jgi:hypothetical protein